MELDTLIIKLVFYGFTFCQLYMTLGIQNIVTFHFSWNSIVTNETIYGCFRHTIFLLNVHNSHPFTDGWIWRQVCKIIIHLFLVPIYSSLYGYS